MKKRLLLAAILWGLVLHGGGGASAIEPSFRIIVNPSNPISAVGKDKLGRIFLKRTVKWDDGTIIVPVDQTKLSPARVAFSKAILDSTPAAVESYWLKKLYSGEAVPPPERESDSDVVFYVRRNAGAIGYVSATAAVEGVKVLTVLDLP